MVPQEKTTERMDDYFSGQRLYGDDMTESEIKTWYQEEGEGYANLGAADTKAYRYVYHALNWWHAYRKINLPAKAKVLGFGSAYGDELLPVLNKTSELTIIDPSDAFVRDTVHGVPCCFVKPVLSGALPFESGAFDLVTAFGVLHHVPNVTAVVRELGRVVRPQGLFLLREPIVSMGDWRQPRPGLTRHERGIPLHLLRGIVEEAGFEILSEQLCVFPVFPRVFRWIRPDVYNSRLLTILDAWFSILLSWNLNYHPKKTWQKVRPTSAFFVLRKKPVFSVPEGSLA